MYICSMSGVVSRNKPKAAYYYCYRGIPIGRNYTHRSHAHRRLRRGPL